MPRRGGPCWWRSPGRSSPRLSTDDPCHDNSCIYKLFCYDCFCVNHFSGNNFQTKGTKMSTETVNQQIPTGTWTVDPVHSTIHFASPTTASPPSAAASTQLRGDADRRRGAAARGHRRGRQHRHRRGELKGHLLSPDFFDAEQAPAAEVQLDRARASTTTAASGSRGELEIRGQTHEVEAIGRFAQRRRRPRRQRADRPLARGRRSTAASFGLDWKADLPSGGQALEYEVAINVELELVAEAE